MSQRSVMVGAALAAAALLAGCATSYSQLSGQRYHKATIDTYPVAIVSVDGESAPLRLPVYVEPGTRRVTVQAPPGGAQSYGDQQTLTLDVKPCTRYWLVAVKENRLSGRFTPKVDYAEPIAGCTPPA